MLPSPSAEPVACFRVAISASCAYVAARRRGRAVGPRATPWRVRACRGVEIRSGRTFRIHRKIARSSVCPRVAWAKAPRRHRSLCEDLRVRHARGGGASGLDGSQGADILQPQPQHAQHTLRRCVSAPHPCAARRWRPPSALRDSDAPFLFQPGFDMDYTLAQVRSGLLAGTAPRKGETPARRHSHSRRPSRGV